MAWERVILQDGKETMYSEPCTEIEARDWLDIKAASHTGKGWTVVRGLDSIDVTKTYIEGPVSSKARRLFIREVG